MIGDPWPLSILAIRNRMVATKFCKALVEGVCHNIVVVFARQDGAITDGLELEGVGHAPKFEISKEEVGMGQVCILARSVEALVGGLRHGASRVRPSAAALGRSNHLGG